MPTQDRRTTIRHRARHLPVVWRRVALVAVVLALVDGFWATTVRGAVGAIGAAQHPFGRWWRDAAVTVPLFWAAVVGALGFAAAVATRRGWSNARRSVAGFAFVVLAATFVGVAVVSIRAATDYRTQRAALVRSHDTHSPVASGARCTSLCSALRLTAAAHRTATAQAAVLLATSNVVVCGTVALLAGRWWRPRRSASLRVA